MKYKAAMLVSRAEESRFIDALMQNNDLAYESLVRQFSPKLYAISRRFFDTEDDVKECLQKTFIQVYKNISAFNQDSSLKTWMHRIAVNEALMMIRQRKKQNTTSLESFTQRYNEFGERTEYSDSSGCSLSQNLEINGDIKLFQDSIIHKDNDVEAQFEKNETKLSLNSIIFQLPEKYCNVLLLRDIQEISTRETAHILALSEPSVKTQLHRARLLLKAFLEQQDQDNVEHNWKRN